MKCAYLRIISVAIGVFSICSQNAAAAVHGFDTPSKGEKKWTSPKGNVYEGIWKNGDLSEGRVTMADGVYTGQLKNLILDGFGVMKYKNGDIYKGTWQGGHKHGLGRLEKKNGRIEFGHWKNGELIVQKGKNFRHEDYVYGIDLSHHQRPDKIDWNRLAIKCDGQGRITAGRKNNLKYSHPVSFVYLRAVFGNRPDQTFKSHLQNARNHQIPVGAYHFFSIFVDVESQIKAFKNAYKRLPGDLPPVLDLENERENDLKGYEAALRKHGVKKMQADVLKWLEAIENHYGVKPVIYTRETWIRDFLDNPKIRAYSKWLARYHMVRPSSDNWIFWQMSDNVYPSGYGSNIDVNRFNGNNREFQRYLKKLK